MKSGQSARKQLYDLLNPGGGKLRNKATVFLICLVISVIIWFLIVLSKESVTTLTYPIRFINMPEDLALINQPDSIITFRVTSAGFDLFTLKYLTRKQPVEVDLSNLNLESRDGFYSATFSTSNISELFFDNFHFSSELISINPEFLYFRFELMEGKRVPVVPRLNLSFEKMYRLADSITLIPDSVLLIGSKHMLKRIHQVETVEKQLKNISGSRSVKAEIDLAMFKGHLNVVPEWVDITINAEKFTEASLSVPVESANPDIHIKTFPDQVKVTYFVSLNNYNRVDPNMFRAVISLPETGFSARSPVKLVAKPAYVSDIKIEPTEVEYLVLKDD